MDRWVGKVAVVTGASSGIGAAIAKALVENGLLVVGIARRIDKIEDLSRSLADQPGKLFSLRCDVAKEEDILRSFRWIAENVGPIHILINNAGLIRPTNLTGKSTLTPALSEIKQRFAEGSTEDWRKIFDVNVIALCICTREAIKVMRQKKVAGHIVHINSVVGHVVPVLPKPVFNVYPASKHAVTALTETLRQELIHLDSDIKVTSISPGVVTTEFQENLPNDGTKEAISRLKALRPEDVAGSVLYVLGTAPHVHVQELIIRPMGTLV